MTLLDGVSVHLDADEKIKLFYYSVLFLLLFMGLTALFGTIHGFYCIISADFYHYLKYFQ